MNKKRPPFEGLYIYILIAVIAFMLADLVILKLRQSFFPQPAVVSAKKGSSNFSSRRNSSKGKDYSSLTKNNIFNADGIIPPTLLSLNEGAPAEEPQEFDGDPVLSSLPFQLIGTLVHGNPYKSLATIKLNSSNESNSYKVGEDIDGQAVLEAVVRRRAIIRNNNNERLEYIELPDEGQIERGSSVATTNFSEPSAPSRRDSPVRRQGNTFKFDRKTKEQYMTKMNKIINEAKAVPVKDADGNIDCYKLQWIKKGSIINDLGFKADDCISHAGGDKLGNIQQVLKMFQQLKNADNLDISLKRNGQTEDFQYVTE